MNLFDELGFFMLHSAGGGTETVRGIGVLAIVSALAQDAISVKAFGKTEQYLPIESDNTTDYPNTLTGWGTYVCDGTESWSTGSSLGSTIYFTANTIGCLYNSSSNRRIYNENYLTADTLPASSARHGYVLRGNSASDSWIGFGEVDDYTPTTWATYLTTHPQTVLFPLHTSDGSTWQAVKRTSDDKFGYLCTSGTEKGTFVGAKGMNGTVAITPLTRAEIYCNNGIIVGGHNFLEESTCDTINVGTVVSNRSGWVIDLPAGTYTVSSGATASSYVRTSTDGGETWSNYTTVKNTTPYTFTEATDFKVVVYGPGSIDVPTFVGRENQLEIGSTPTAYTPTNITTGTQETITDGTSSVSFGMLNKCGDYTDVHDAITGQITRNCKVLILDGTERWSYSGGKIYSTDYLVSDEIGGQSKGSIPIAYCNIANFNGTGSVLSDMNTNDFLFNVASGNYNGQISFYNAETTDVARWTGYLAEQYANGTPVIVVLPRLNNPTTESVTPQTFPVPAGNSTAVISGSIADLEGEITYMKG